ncbi:hypothetical protein CSKR_105544, partial [Clonorchis sinensis]
AHFTFQEKSFSCSTLLVPNCHFAQRKHEGWDSARLSKHRQEKSRGRGQVRTTDLPSLFCILFKSMWAYMKINEADGWMHLLPVYHLPVYSTNFSCETLKLMTWTGILPGYSDIDWRRIRVIDQNFWLKSLTSRERCLAGNVNTRPFLWSGRHTCSNFQPGGLGYSARQTSNH